MSTDSPKANTTFQTKQNLPYPLLCDPSATLIGAIGLKKAPKGTTRGVFVVDKAGKVLIAQPGGPEVTVNVVKELVKGLGGKEVGANGEEEKKEEVEEEEAVVDAPVEETNGDAVEEKKEEEGANGEDEKKEE